MTGPEFNPYQSPRMVTEIKAGNAADEQQSLAELQARIAALEAKLNDNWFYGPTWKRSVAVIGHFFLGYGLIVGVGGAIMWTAIGIGCLLGSRWWL